MKKKPGISQQIGKRKDDEAAETQRALAAMHREIEQLKAEQVVVRYVGPRMYKREVYGK